MKKLIYLIGEPGIGKTTTMRELTSRLEMLGELEKPGRILYGNAGTGWVAAVELGRRRPGGFSGTDALPMAVIGEAERYVRTAVEAPLLLAEGARLANRRFLGAAVDAGWDTHLVYLTGPDLAAERRRLRGSTQSDSWVKGAATRAHNLYRAPGPDVTTHAIAVDPNWGPDRIVAQILAQHDIEEAA